MIRAAPSGQNRGGSIVGYAGGGTIKSWTTFYDDLFAESTSQPAGDWQADFGNWRRRFTSAGTETVDIVIRHDGAETLHSLVLISPNETPDP